MPPGRPQDYFTPAQDLYTPESSDFFQPRPEDMMTPGTASYTPRGPIPLVPREALAPELSPSMYERWAAEEQAPNQAALESGAGILTHLIGGPLTAGFRALESYPGVKANSYELVNGKPTNYVTPNKIKAAHEAKAAKDAAAAGTTSKTDTATTVGNTATGALAGSQAADDAENVAKKEYDPYVSLAQRLGAERSAQQILLDSLEKGGKQEMENDLGKIRAAYQKADAELAGLQVDKQRWQKDTPTLVQALLVIASGGYGFLTKGQGPNPILHILDRAITNDVDTQMANYNMALKRNQLGIQGAEREAYDRQKLRTAMWSRAVSGLSQIEQNAQTEAALLGAKFGREVTEQKLALEYAKYYTTAHQALNKPMGTSLAKIDRKSHDMVSATPAYARNMRQLIDMWEKADASGTGLTDVASGFIPGTDENEYKRLVENSALLEGAALQGRQLTDNERKAVQSSYPGLLDPRSTGKTFFLRKIQDMKKNIEGVIRSNQGKADIRPAIDAYREIEALEQEYGERTKSK